MERFLPPDISSVGHWVDQLFVLALWLTGIAFAVVVIAMVVMLIVYRARPGRRAFYTHGDSPRAVAFTLGLAIVVFFAIDVNLAYHDHRAWDAVWGTPPRAGEALRIEVLAEQFAWHVRYPGPDGLFRTEDDVTTINQVRVPKDRPVIIQLSSRDVMHSFFLPNLRIKMDAVPGMVTSLYFRATQFGAYNIACAEHCGFGHYSMRGFLIVETAEQLDAWLREQAAAGPANVSWGWAWDEGA